MYRGSRKSSFLPEPWGYNSRVLWEVHCGVWRLSWWSSLSSRRSRRRPVNPSRRRDRRYRVYSPPDVAWWRSVGPAGQGLACSSGNGARGDPGPPNKVLACPLRRSEGRVEAPDPSKGRSGPPVASARRPSPRGSWRHRTPSRAGGGSGAIRVMRWSHDGRSWQNSNGTVSSALRPASQVPQCCHSVRDGGAGTGVGGWDSGHSHCGEWRPDAVCPGHCGGVVGT
jgi:hypothetical protein